MFITKKCAAGFLTGLFMLAGVSSLFANDFSVWAGPKYTLKNGHFNQTVLSDAGGKDKILTEHSFDENLLSYIGLETGFAWRFISLQADFDWGIPKAMGNMTEDKHHYDYQNVINSHKEFDTSLEAENFALDTALKFDIPVIQNWLNVKPFLAFSYSISKESASFTGGRMYAGDSRNDYRPGSYSDKSGWEMSTQPIASAGNVWYKREMYNLRLGAEVEGTFFNHLFVNINGQAAPLTFLNSVYSNGTGAYYLDQFKTFFAWWSFGGGIGGRFGKDNCFEVGVKGQFSFMPSIRGTSFYSSEEKSGYKEYHDGTFAKTDFSNWQVGIYGKYTFTFGPTHTPRARPAREKKEKAPKIRDGKVNVKVY